MEMPVLAMENLTILLAWSVPILAILMGCGLPMIAIYFDYKKRRAIYQLHHEERLAAIEKGLEIPPLPESFFSDPDDAELDPPERRYVLRGLIWLFAGMGAIWGLSQMDALPATLGAIPTGIGSAYLLYYLIAGRKEPSPEPPPLAENNRNSTAHPSQLSTNSF